MNPNKNIKIYVAGHKGMVGSAICRALQKLGYTNLATRSSSELDLTNQNAVNEFIEKEKPEQIYLAAAKVGGILANNNFPADFIYKNIMIEANVINAGYLFGVKQLLFLGSSCIYPKFANQPIKEDSLLTGILEPTNEPYAIAKIAGIKLCESYNRQFGESHGLDYRSVMPTNLYGPGDNYHPENSHVIPGLISRFREAVELKSPEVFIWGDGSPTRDFLYVDDIADASVFIMNYPKEKYSKFIKPMRSHINIGYGKDITIKDLAYKISELVGFKGKILFDVNKPNGSPKKLMDCNIINEMGWSPKVSLVDGLRKTIDSLDSVYKG